MANRFRFPARRPWKSPLVLWCSYLGSSKPDASSRKPRPGRLLSFLPMAATDERRAVLAIAPTAREGIARALSLHFAEDNIDTDELERRLARVYAATTMAELNAIVADLPATAAQAAVLAPRPPAERISALFSGQEQRITGEVPRRLEVRGRLGYVELDLTRASFAPGLTEIDVRAFMGYVQIRLPAGVRIENRGRALFGFFALKGRGTADDTAAVVRITGRATFGFAELFARRDQQALPKPDEG